MKVAVITCYSEPDYIRARGFRMALKTIPKVKPIIIKNKHRGLLRYPEVLWKLWQVRRKQRPDAYLLTFRGQEILPFVLLLARKKPVWFDEFVVPLEYANDLDQPKSVGRGLKSFLARRGFTNYKRWLHRCSAVLAGSSEQAELSARVSHMNLSTYVVIPTPEHEPSAGYIAIVARLLRPLTDGVSS